MKIKYLFFATVLATAGIYAEQYDTVKITPDITHVFIYHKGKAVNVHRIQDTQHKLTGDYAKTYRPGTYIQPMNLNNGVKTIGEVEVLDFMKEEVNKKKGMLIDVRDKEKYKDESIPSAVNIPVKIGQNSTAMKKIFQSVGMVLREDGTWETQNAMELVVYCDGLWSNQSAEMIDLFLKMGYPAEKIYYYRGGFQMWKILGFTTVRN